MELVVEDTVGACALVEAVAATFHAKAIRTYDLDVAVSLPPAGGASLSLDSLAARHGLALPETWRA